MKRLYWLLAALIIFHGASRAYFKMTDDFRIANINDELPYRSEYATEDLRGAERKKLDSILSQNFHYIGKGAQSYVFGTEDEKYVIKFFKFKHHRPRMLVRILPPIGSLKEFKEKHYAKKYLKFHSAFKGYKLGFDSYRKECGLIAVHLNRTEGIYPEVHVRDKLGFPRTIGLDPIVFVVQERGVTFQVLQKKALLEGDLAKAKWQMRKIMNFFQNEYAMGLRDKDRCVMKNTGFVGDRVIRMDVGMLERDPTVSSLDKQVEYLAIARNEYHLWLSKNFPQYYDELLADFDDHLHGIYGDRYRNS